jgi:hypothetical protein
VRPEETEEPGRDVEAGVAFHEYGRWLLDWQWRRADAYERKASQLLAFVGVLLALLPASVDPIHHVSDDATRAACSGLAIAAAVLLGLAGCSATVCLARRRVAGPPLRAVQAAFRRHDTGEGPSSAILVNRVSRAIYGAVEKPDESPIVAMQDDAKMRGRWFQRSAVLTCVAIGLLATLLPILVMEHARGG